jgi:hypothetical protein
VLSAALGLVSIACAVIAWRSGNRTAIRINAAAPIINGVLTLPGFFVHDTAFIKVLSGGSGSARSGKAWAAGWWAPAVTRAV